MEHEQLRERARRWAEHDPDPDTRAALRDALARDDLGALRSAVADPLTFGTAGLRGEVGPGPARMNRATVLRATAGLAAYLAEHRGDDDGPVVVGFDARPDSHRFATDVVATLLAAGREVVAFDQPVPTPLVAWLALDVAAAAAVVVTASHNPPDDNGYKVYDHLGIQIVPPTDGLIAAAIDAAPPADEVPRAERPWEHERVEVVGHDTIRRYLDELRGSGPQVSSRTRPTIVHTSLHGVGGEVTVAALADAGFTDVHVVAAQHEPDGTFPTVDFPNPEEDGALDLALALAEQVDADVVLANDPDADRLAVAVRADDGWRQLTGNEVAVLLAEHLLPRSDAGERALVTASIVTTPWLGDVAAAHGAHHETTLTGFKWIWHAAHELATRDGLVPVLGTEEALGYSVGTLVRDKDGIAAAVAVAGFVATLADAGRTLLDELGRMRERDGVWASTQVAARRDGPGGAERIAAAMARAVDVARGLDHLGGHAVVAVVDLRRGGEDRAAWLPDSPLVRVDLADGRLLCRPSGTEPKLKVYVDLRGDPGADPTEQRGEAERIGRAWLDALEV